MVISKGLHKIGGMVIEAGITTVTGANELDSTNRYVTNCGLPPPPQAAVAMIG
jgi:hypothetical protein